MSACACLRRCCRPHRGGCIRSLSLAVEPSSGLVALVVRRLDAESYLALPKYTRSPRGPWRAPLIGPVERVFRVYETRHLLSAVNPDTFDPRYGATVPVYTPSGAALICGGSDCIPEPLRAELPEPLARLADRGCLYTTGSHASCMARSWSDLDLVVDGAGGCWGHLLDLLYSERPRGAGPPPEEYFAREAGARGLDPAIVRRLLPWWQRFTLPSGVEVSVALADTRARCSPERRLFRVHANKRVRVRVESVAGEARGLLDYPGLAAEPGIVVYDGFYTGIMLAAGCVEAEGLHVEAVLPDGSMVEGVALGAREGPTLLRPCS